MRFLMRKHTSLSVDHKKHVDSIKKRQESEFVQYGRRNIHPCENSEARTAKREGIPPVKIQGVCKETLAEIPIVAQHGGHEMKIKVAGWFDGRAPATVVECSYTPGSKEGTFEMSVPVPQDRPTEFLKLAILCEMTDQETGNVKPFPLETLAISLRDTLYDLEVKKKCSTEGSTVVEDQTNVFNDVLHSHLSVKVLNLHEYMGHEIFVESPIRMINSHNKSVDGLVVAMRTKMEKNNLRPPEPAIPFYTGTTYMPFGGVPSMQIPPLKAHYALLGAMLEGLDRKYPLGLPLYFLNVAMAHSGYTREDVEEILAQGCRSREYARLVGDILLGFTKDAACMTYQRDGTLSVELQDILTKPMMRLCITGTEDINIVGTTQSLMTEATQNIPKDEIINVHRGMSMSQIRSPLHHKMYTEISRCFGKDDCESSAMAALIIGKTIRDADLSVENLVKTTKNWGVFEHYTHGSYEFSSKVLSQIQADLRSGAIKLAPVVSLAGGASVDNDTETKGKYDMDAETDYLGSLKTRVEKEKQMIDKCNAGGHCFGLLRMLHPETQQVYNMILEGTNSTRMMSRDEIFDVKVRVNKPDSKDPSKTIKMNSCDFLSALSHIVSVTTQVCVQECSDEVDTGCGLRDEGSQVENYCRVRSQMAIFEEDPAFYKWFLHIGLVGDQFCGVIPCSMNKWDRDSKLAAGMFPGEANSDELHAIVIDPDMFPDRSRTLCASYLNEIYMPIAEDCEFVRVTNMWAKCSAIEKVNAHLRRALTVGTKYIVINSMETALAPALTPVVLAAKQKLCDMVNDMQTKDPQNDGIVAWVSETGTGVTWSTAVPVGLSKEVTFIHNLRTAGEKLGFAGASH